MSCAVLAAGCVTPSGLTLAETAASTRARLARLQAIEWLDRRFEPFVVGRVPNDGLPDVTPALGAQLRPSRESRMLQLAHAALADVLGGLPPQVEPPPLLLALPEHHTTVAIEPARFLQRLALQAGPCFDLGSSIAAPRGRAAGLMAFKQALQRIEAGQSRFVLVGGVDSLVDLHLLGSFDREDRIRGETISDGFSPSEGAAFVLLGDAETARTYGMPPLATVISAAIGQEPGHLYSDEPYLGNGLASAVTGAIESAQLPTPITSVFCSFNGERYWAREFGVARIRNAAAFADDAAMEHPAECFGDLGAAHGVALAALAAHGISRGYRRAPALVYASSDYADRAAAILDRAA